MSPIDFHPRRAASAGGWIARALVVAALAGCGAGDDREGEVAGAVSGFDSTFTVSPGPEEPVSAGNSDVDDDRWTTGSVTSERAISGAVTVTGIRVASHDSFDRFVITIEGAALPTLRAGFAQEPPTYCGSGEPVQIRGDAVLMIGLEPAQAHDDAGNVTVQPRDTIVDLPALLEVRIVCDFEGQAQWALGLARTSPYRILELTAPTRIGVDIQH